MRVTRFISFLVIAVAISLGLASAALAQSRPSTAPLQGGATAVMVPLHGAIDDVSAKDLLRRLDRARKMGASVAIIDLDTPGGSVASTLTLTHALRAETELRTIAWIRPRAYSAGTMIALACDEIIMSRGAVIGDCAPIQVNSRGGMVSLRETERAKAVSPVLADFRESAKLRGYDPLLTDAMVTIEPVVYLLKNQAGEYKVAPTTAAYQALLKDGTWVAVPDVQQPVDNERTLLTVHTDIAMMLGLARGVADTPLELSQLRNLNIVDTLETGWGELALDILNSAGARSLLLALFFMCLYAALHAPGHGMAEVGAVISMALLVLAPLLTGYAQWWEVAIIILGIALLAVELFLIPGFGVTGVSGLALIVGGFLLTFMAPEPSRGGGVLQEIGFTWEALVRGLGTLVVGLLLGFFLIFWLRRYLPHLPYLRGLILTTSVGSTDAAMVGSLSNIDPMAQAPAIGSFGLAATELKPGGSAEFHDSAGRPHLVGVVSDSGYVARGSRVRVIEVSGNRIVVRPEREA